MLSDERLFRSKSIKLFNKEEWNELRCYYFSGKLDEYENKINGKKKELLQKYIQLDQSEPRNEQKLKYYSKLIVKADSLNASKNNKILLGCVLQKLTWYGIVDCPLPNKLVNDISRVIEDYGITKAEEFISSKISKIKKPAIKDALRAMYNYMKELESINESKFVIGYFIKNLPSLTVYWCILDGTQNK